jgi:hypothetical protein
MTASTPQLIAPRQKLRWYQFSLRTLFVVATACAVVCAIIKCETDARRDFAAKVAAVQTALGKTLPEVEQEIYQRWLQQAKTTNPTFASWQELFKPLRDKDKVRFAVCDVGSSESNDLDYFERKTGQVRYRQDGKHATPIVIS